MKYAELEANLATQTLLLASTSAELARVNTSLLQTKTSLANSIGAIEESLSLTKSESEEFAEALSATLSAEQEKVAQLQEETKKIGGTVGTLEKLSQTDPELLQKYSKVYFLNEHYVPSELSEIKNMYLYSEAKTQYIHSNVLNSLTSMLDDAALDGETIYVKSAYRSFNEQEVLKNGYSVTYGEGSANQFSADQGYSEHQLGTTVDLITTGLGGQLYGFDTTTSYTWLLNNAYKYGFILSYPENNEYYIFEPWHWRFVGVELATYLNDNNISFYDMDQRDIDEYLVSIFD